MIIEISIAVIAVAFVILVVYLIIALKSLSETLLQVNETLKETRPKIEELTAESVKFLRNTNEISGNLQLKMESLDPLFRIVSLVGNQAAESVERFRSPKNAASIDEEEELASPSKSQNKIFDLMEWIAVGVNLLLSLKKRR